MSKKQTRRGGNKKNNKYKSKQVMVTSNHKQNRNKRNSNTNKSNAIKTALSTKKNTSSFEDMMRIPYDASTPNNDYLPKINLDYDEHSVDPFSDWERSKHRHDLLKWVQSLTFLYFKDTKDTSNPKLCKERDRKVIEMITRLQQHGICSIPDLIYLSNERAKQLLSDWKIRGQQKKQFLFALKCLRLKYNDKKSKLSTDTAIAQAFMQSKSSNNKSSSTQQHTVHHHHHHHHHHHNPHPHERERERERENEEKEKQKQKKKKKKATNIRIINGSKVISQISHLMDIQHFEDAIYLTEKALKIMDEEFGFNLIEKTHCLIASPMYFKSSNVHKNQNRRLININININISISATIEEEEEDVGKWLPTAPSIQQSFSKVLSSLFVVGEKEEKKQQRTRDDIIRLADRGFLIDLSGQNAELVPLGLLRRMYPIVLWKCGRCTHGIVAIREILNEQALNGSSHAIYGALLYQIGRIELCRSSVISALHMSSNRSVLARLLDILLTAGERERASKLTSLMSFVSSCAQHLDYFVHCGDDDLVADGAICDGDLCVDDLVYAMYLQHLLCVVVNSRGGKQQREVEVRRKRRRKTMDELCSKMLHLKASSICVKYLVASVYIWHLNKYEDGGALLAENIALYPVICSKQNVPYFVAQSYIWYGLYLQKFAKDYRASLAVFESIDYRKYFGFGLMQCGEYDEARQYYLAQQMSDVSCYMQMATLLANLGQFARSNEYFESALEYSAPGNAGDVLLLWSSAMLLCGKYELAERKLSQIKAAEREHDEQYMYLSSMCKLECGRMREAESSFKSLLKRYPSSSDGHCYYANCLADLNKREVAEKHWEDAIHLNPANISAHYFYGLWLWHNSEMNRAIYHLKECLRINEKHCNSRFILAHCCAERKEWKQAEKHFKFICDHGDLKQKPHQNMIYLSAYGDCLIEIGDRQGAVAKYTKSLKLLKSLKKALNIAEYTQNDCCCCHYYLNSNDMLHFYAAFECETRQKLATILARCKELKPAYAECEKCLKLCPNHIEAIFRFASILSNLKKYKKAEKYFKKCLTKTNQKHGKCWNNYGVMKLNMNRYDDAMHFFKKALYVLKHQPAAIREVQKNIDLCKRKKCQHDSNQSTAMENTTTLKAMEKPLKQNKPTNQNNSQKSSKQSNSHHHHRHNKKGKGKKTKR